MGLESPDFSDVAPVPLIGRGDLDYERIRTGAAAHVTVDMVTCVKQQRWTSDSKSEKHECDASNTSQSNTATVFSEDEDEDSDIDETGEDLDIMDDLDAIPSASTKKWRREWADPRLEAKEPSESSEWGAENKPKRLPELKYTPEEMDDTEKKTARIMSLLDSAVKEEFRYSAEADAIIEQECSDLIKDSTIGKFISFYFYRCQAFTFHF
jgi:hypothetical protein